MWYCSNICNLCSCNHNKWSEIFDERPHSGGVDDSWGQCNMAPTSLEYCSQLKQSCCHFVFGDWIILLHAIIDDCIHRSRDATMLFGGPDNLENCPFSMGGCWSPSNMWFLGPMRFGLQNGISKYEIMIVLLLYMISKFYWASADVAADIGDIWKLTRW